MKIFVVGAGATGSVLINTLAGQKEVERIFCVAKNKRIAAEFVKSHPKVKIFGADVADRTKMEKFAKGSDLVINAASPWLNVPILKLALRVHAHYQDLEAYLGLDDGRSKMPYRIEHLSFDKEFRKQRRVALFDAGVAPGLTNLLVAEAQEVLGNLKNVSIRLLEDLQASAYISTWSPSAAIDEVYSRPVVYRNGKFSILKRFSDPEEFNFPKPFGRHTTYAIMNNEAFTIPQYLSVGKIEVRSAGCDDEAARIMVALGLLEKKPMRIRGITLTPLEFTMRIMRQPPTPKELKRLVATGVVRDGYFAFFIEATGPKKRKIAYWVPFPSQKTLFKKDIHSTYVAHPAGTCAAVFALEIPHIQKYGTMPPEVLPKDNRERILKRIKQFGINVKTR
ncbi:MAG: saccharopine dehydrogenase NADP-binding domain-containing protein [bacterium]|nr:saccharopine dehydrogenase NADP-binding domain-containing protein [bacterium]